MSEAADGTPDPEVPVDPPAEEDREPPPSGHGALARRTRCKYCKAELFSARCDDGQWRTFELPDYPPTVEGVWVWHKHHGMQEYVRFGRPAHPGEPLVPGKRLHFCSERAAARMRLDTRNP